MLNDPGVFRYGGREFKNAGDAVYGSLALPRALQVSSDVFFYQLGASLNDRGPIIQDWARKLSFGEPTGIDLPGEYGGLVPDRKWRDKGFAEYQKCAKKAKVPVGTQEALFACGGIERQWSGGDNVNLSVGQGDLQATPLQLAVAYAALANGGRVVTPHLGQEVAGRRRAPAGGDPQAARPQDRHRSDAARRDLDGLLAAATQPGGTSTDVFTGFPYPVHGKTGTAERQPERRPVLVRVLGRRPLAPDRRRGDRRGGRLRRRGRGPGGAPHPREVVRGRRRRLRAGGEPDPMSRARPGYARAAA